MIIYGGKTVVYNYFAKPLFKVYQRWQEINVSKEVSRKWDQLKILWLIIHYHRKGGHARHKERWLSFLSSHSLIPVEVLLLPLVIHWSQLTQSSSLLFLSLSLQSSWLQALFQCSSYFSSCPPLSLPLPSNQQHPTSSSPTSSKWALELPWLLLIWPCPSRWIGSASEHIKKRV